MINSPALSSCSPLLLLLLLVFSESVYAGDKFVEFTSIFGSVSISVRDGEKGSHFRRFWTEPGSQRVGPVGVGLTYFSEE